MKSPLLLLMPALLLAQDYETTLGTETAEFLAGVQNQHAGPTDPVYGAKLVSGLSRMFSLYGEYSYSRLRSETVHLGPTIKSRTSLSDFGGGVEAHMSGYRFQPYVLGGIGAIRDSGKFSYGSETQVSNSHHFAYSLGVGVRYFVKGNFGFIAEVKTVDGKDRDRFERYAVGVFFQRARPRW